MTRQTFHSDHRTEAITGPRTSEIMDDEKDKDIAHH
jgi:hypothetical protein